METLLYKRQNMIEEVIANFSASPREPLEIMGKFTR